MANFPTEVPSAEFDLLIDVVLSRGNHSTGDIVRAGWFVEGFVLGKIFSGGPVVAGAARPATLPDNADERAKLLEDAKAKHKPGVVGDAGAVPWGLIWALVQSIVEKFLPK